MDVVSLSTVSMDVSGHIFWFLYDKLSLSIFIFVHNSQLSRTTVYKSY